MMFGNSRGRFRIERHAGWEHELGRLFEAADEAGMSGYGIDFENDVFMCMTYYWGDCTCGYDELEDHPFEHREDCYQVAYRKIKEDCKNNGYGWNSEEERKLVSDLCDKFHYPYPSGCAVHCGCDYAERVQKWHEEKGYPEGHLDTCMFRKPNFWYKPTGLKIEWYKYPLRDSYINQEIKLRDFMDIIDECIKSLDSV